MLSLLLPFSLLEACFANEPQFNYNIFLLFIAVYLWYSNAVYLCDFVFVFLSCKFPLEGLLEVWFALAPQFNIVARQHG